MSTVRTPQNMVNENEEVNNDKTMRAASFDSFTIIPSKDEDGDKPLDSTTRGEMPMDGTTRGQMPMDGTTRGQMPMDGTTRGQMPLTELGGGTLRAPGINQPIIASPSGGGTTRASQSQPQPAARPSVNISIISSASSTVRANKLKQQRNEVDDSVFVLKGQNYKRKQVLSENTGEAQVFLVEKDKQEYVLKIYYPNFDVNRKILQTVLNFDFEMIVRVYDYGKTYVDGKHRYYELMEYLHGGSMAEYKLNGDMDKFRRIALQGAAALAYCHQCRILHKDIKPGNVFFRDQHRLRG